MSDSAEPFLPKIPDHELIRCIGAGAFGEVWLAAASSLTDTYRAIKLVHRESLKGDGFQREFKGIQKFEPISRAHPNLVNILHVGESTQTGHFYYVMELGDDLHAVEPPASHDEPPPAFDPATYEARNLQNELQRRGALPAEECCAIAESLASALVHLHGNGLIHRDIKPANVIFVNGVAKLADIGLVADVKSAITFVGTDGFIPQEGVNTPQGDIFSLGKVMYEMVTGLDRNLFPQLPEGWAEAPHRAIRQQLNRVILRACESSLARRYPTAEALYEDLRRIQAGGLRSNAFGAGLMLILSSVAIGLIVLGTHFQQHRSADVKVASNDSERAADFRELFNGKDLDGWSAPGGNWLFTEGALQRVRSGGDITWEREPLPDNFDLRFEWKVEQGSDGGVIYRPGRIEYQILDNDHSPSGKDPKTSAGALFDFASQKKVSPKAVGRWNEGRILCEGARIRHYLNGEEVLDAQYDKPEWEEALHRLKTKYDSSPSGRGGYLIIRDETGVVWFRNIRLKKLT